jgi:hypothetical protein
MHAGGHERGLRGGLVAAHQGDHQLAIGVSLIRSMRPDRML